MHSLQDKCPSMLNVEPWVDPANPTQKQQVKFQINKRPPGLIAPHLLGNPPKNTTKGRDLLFNEGIRLLNMADTSLDRFT